MRPGRVLLPGSSLLGQGSTLPGRFQEAWPGRVLLWPGRVQPWPLPWPGIIILYYTTCTEGIYSGHLQGPHLHPWAGPEHKLFSLNMTWKGTTYGPEEYYSQPWPGPEVLRAYF